MPPKSSAKKRKAPETHQPSLDSFNVTNSGRSKLVTLPKQHWNSPPFLSNPSKQSPRNENPNVFMKVDKKSDTICSVTTLGRFRRKPLFDKIEVHQFQGMEPGTPSDARFDDTWTALKELMEAILTGKPAKTNFQVAYELCQSVCLYGKEKILYTILESALTKHIQQQKDIITGELDKYVYLTTLNRSWGQFCDHLGTIRNIFMELERRYITTVTEYGSILHLGKQIFRKTVMESHQIQQKTISGVMDLIKKDRDDAVIDFKIMRSIIQMLLDLSLYTTVFEPYFMTSTTEYYTVEPTKKLQELSIQDYLRHARHRIEQESKHRIDTYLAESTKIPLTKLVTKLFIHNKLDIILSQGFWDLMDREDTITLNILYHFLPSHQTRPMTKLRTAFANYIKDHGLELIKDPAQDRTMVVTLLQYKDKLDQILKMAFDNNSNLANALKESFENFINSRNTKPAEMLAKFIDGKLRSGAKKQQQELQNEDLEELLNKVLMIFRYIQGKDIFEAFYKRFLSKRLLLNRTVSNDAEKSVLSKIKSECGPDFTKNLESMFKDMEISADLNLAFKDSKEYTEQGNISLSVNVLAQGVWPAHPTADIILPTNMTSMLDAYQLFYTNKFTGRKLTWRHALGTCILKAHFPMAKKELSVSLFQAIVLMLFNDKSKSMMSYKDIALATDLDGKELKRVLQSLSCGKYIILNKYPNNNGIAEDDTFQYNDKFTASTYRLKINIIQQEQLVEEQKEIQTKVLVDRQYQLEAAIVRIMKSRKCSTHKNLVQELFAKLKFPTDDRDIKDRIERLIERGYLIRDETDMSIYFYQS